MAPIRTALVGYGYAGKTIHAPLIRAAEGLELHTVVSSRPVEVHADLPNVRVCDFATALADPDIDLVVIATPNTEHAPQAIAALKAGKHVVIDKPFALSVSEGKAVIEAAATARRQLSVFHCRRWDSDHLTLKALLKDGALGRVTRYISRYDRFRPVIRDRWRERTGPGAGIWFDLGSHLLDQALDFFGWPEAILADIGVQRNGAPDGMIPADDYFNVTLFYSGGFRASLCSSCLSVTPGPRFEVHGLNGAWFKYGMDTQEDSLKAGRTPGDDGWGADRSGVLTPVVDNVPGAPTEWPTMNGNYLRFYEAMARAITYGEPLPVTAPEAIRVMRLLEAGVRSATEGRKIAV